MGNVETAQQIYASFRRGDIPAILEQLAEDVEWDNVPVSTDVPWLQKRLGRNEVVKFFEAMAHFELNKFEPKTFLENGNIVVVLIDLELTVKATGIGVVEEEVHIWHFNPAGKVSRFVHKVDTHQHWAAYKGEVLKVSQASA
ncbi:MAG: nuclear transport factor 2 family protein [Acidobacteriota bacterium]|nr:nuclear transport factor 2 family protein [Acidobacteriota bacterium]